MPVKIRNNQTILFIGDSITDCGRRAAERPLGNGYVKIFADMVTVREPAKKITIINKGISGDRITGLRNRWSDDVLRHKPNWLSVKIGINDLHSVLLQREEPVTPELFREAYDDILSRTKRRLPRCRILLVDPFYLSIEKSRSSFRKEVLDLLPQYLRVVHQMSTKYKTRLVRTHDLFQKLLRKHEADTFCAEPVHPNLTGHLAIAEAVYSALSR
ncbi:MAG: SGNH/GDSL hydrolase family protein [Planctomycetes bacterium]|nr:SGNH/GDSL hydrolase family protein [Planctomycetota bacterium]